MKKFVIFGNPVIHSKSPQMQNAGLKPINFDGFYDKFLLEDLWETGKAPWKKW